MLVELRTGEASICGTGFWQLMASWKEPGVPSPVDFVCASLPPSAGPRSGLFRTVAVSAGRRPVGQQELASALPHRLPFLWASSPTGGHLLPQAVTRWAVLGGGGEVQAVTGPGRTSEPKAFLP